MKLLVGIIFLFFTQVATAQDVYISNGTKLTNKVPKFRILGKVDNKYVVHRYGSSFNIIDIYTSALKKQQSKQIKLDKNQTLEKIWITPTGGKLLIVESEKDYSILKVAKMDKRLSISQKMDVLDTIWERRDLITNNLRTEFSLNETVIGIYLPIYKSGKIDYFSIRTYDANFNLLNQSKLANTNAVNNSFVDFEVLNDGSFIFIVQDESFTLPVFYTFYGQANSTVFTNEIRFAEPFFKKPKFEIDNKNKQLLIAGFYESDDRKKRERGAYKFFLSKFSLATGSQTMNTIAMISDEFYSQLTGREPQGDVNVLFTFYMNKIIPKTNGGAIVMAESYYKEEEQMQSGLNAFGMPSFGSFSSISIYHYNDVVLFDIDSAGNVISNQIVRKRQVSENDRGAYSSFFVMNQQDKIRLLFIDDISEQANFSEYVFSNESFNKPTSMFNLGEKEIFPVSKMAYQPAINEIVLPSFVNNEFSLVKIVYN